MKKFLLFLFALLLLFLLTGPANANGLVTSVEFVAGTPARVTRDLFGNVVAVDPIFTGVPYGGTTYSNGFVGGTVIGLRDRQVFIGTAFNPFVEVDIFGRAFHRREVIRERNR